MDHKDFPVGTLVKSVCGRDRKRVFIVIGKTDETPHSRLLVTDGSLRSSESPKAKNLKHVKPVGRLTDDEISALRDSLTDGTVRELLSRYDSGYVKSKND